MKHFAGQCESMFAGERCQKLRGHDGVCVSVTAPARANWPVSAPDGSSVSLSTPEPPPVPNQRPAVWDLVQKDMAERDQTGRAKYGTPLQPHNGRDALVDAYQESLDLAVYLRQAIYERDGK